MWFHCGANLTHSASFSLDEIVYEAYRKTEKGQWLLSKHRDQMHQIEEETVSKAGDSKIE